MGRKSEVKLDRPREEKQRCHVFMHLDILYGSERQRKPELRVREW
jgi:hypothetical protein